MPMTLALDLPAPKAANIVKVARHYAESLAMGDPVTRQSLSADMTYVFGASDADGAWTMRDAYEALELAQVLSELRRCTTDAVSPAERLRRLIAQGEALPTQTYRSEAQVALQQFSTPLPLAWLVGRAAALTTTDVVLEPSAGTGLLAAQARRTTSRLHLNEIDPLRAELLAAAFEAPVTRHDAAMIADRLTVRPTVVLMNPPYSKSARIGDDAFAGARHLRSALLALADGGRMVAVMPSWFADASGAAGYDA